VVTNEPFESTLVAMCATNVNTKITFFLQDFPGAERLETEASFITRGKNA
jgi:hypothetical protein